MKQAWNAPRLVNLSLGATFTGLMIGAKETTYSKTVTFVSPVFPTYTQKFMIMLMFMPS